MHLKNELTAEAVRLDNTIANGNDLTAVKAARTRWENKHKAYWEKVYEVRDELEKDARKKPTPTAHKNGVDPADLMEISR